MRGIYQLTNDDRRKFFHAIQDFLKPGVETVDLISTQLSLCNCADLLGELEYEQESWETHGWEGEVWVEFSHPSAPSIYLSADAYVGNLDIIWKGYADGEEIDIEAFKKVMKEKWGKYFPVI